VKLFFMHHDDPDYEVVLCTDASAYGLGGYFCQRHKQTGLETPIQFISGTFTKEQLRWSTNEKEAYAVFYSSSAKLFIGVPKDKSGATFTEVPNVLPAGVKLPTFDEKAWAAWEATWLAYRAAKNKDPTKGAPPSSSSSSSNQGGRGRGRGRGGRSGRGKQGKEPTIDPLLHLAQAVYDSPDPPPKKDAEWAYYCRTVDPKARTNRDYLRDNP
jgi:hypothetical protein